MERKPTARKDITDESPASCCKQFEVDSVDFKLSNGLTFRSGEAIEVSFHEGHGSQSKDVFEGEVKSFES